MSRNVSIAVTTTVLLVANHGTRGSARCGPEQRTFRGTTGLMADHATGNAAENGSRSSARLSAGTRRSGAADESESRDCSEYEECEFHDVLGM